MLNLLVETTVTVIAVLTIIIKVSRLTIILLIKRMTKINNNYNLMHNKTIIIIFKINNKIFKKMQISNRICIRIRLIKAKDKNKALITFKRSNQGS